MEERKIILENLNKDVTINFINEFNITSLILFGSFNSGEFTEESDVDIAVIAKDKIDLENILELELYFERILDREIDVVDLKSDSLDLFLKINILDYGTILYTIDDNANLDLYRDYIDWIYKENRDYIFFRRRDVLSWIKKGFKK